MEGFTRADITKKKGTFSARGYFSKTCPWRLPLAPKVYENIHRKHHHVFSPRNMFTSFWHSCIWEALLRYSN